MEHDDIVGSVMAPITIGDVCNSTCGKCNRLICSPIALWVAGLALSSKHSKTVCYYSAPATFA